MKYFAAFLIFAFVISNLTAQSPTTRPNVVLIVSDDQGWGDLSINGNINLNTPNLDRLAKGGARFRYFFVSPVCSPTRAELLTGRYHPRGGVHSTSAGGERLDLDETCVAQIFKSAGYATAAFGKWHNGMQYPYHPNARGFDEFYGFCSGHWGDYFSPSLEHNGKPVTGNGFIVDDLTDHAMEFMQSHKEKPFFLYLPYNLPHSPMQVPGRWWKKFKDKKLEMLYAGEEKEDIQNTRAALAMCENVDWNVGRLMNKLKDLKLEDNTIVLYLSDNGPAAWRWNGGMKGKKGSTDEGGVRSPLFIRWPAKIEPGKEIPQIAAAIDLFPTLIELAAIDYAERKPLDGISLKTYLLEKNAAWQERLIFSHWNGDVSVRSQRYRLDRLGRLFDMQNDPGQVRDVSAEFFPIAEALRKAADKWRAEVLSELPKEDSRPFTLGDTSAEYTQFPARDGIARGNIKRSNRFPNSSFFTNWRSVEDQITWYTEVLAAGDFEVQLYYTCPEKDKGSTFELTFNNSRITAKIAEGYDPPLRGMEHDRVKRKESYVKDFKRLVLGIMSLEKGTGNLTLKAVDIPASQVADVRMLMFRRIGNSADR